MLYFPGVALFTRFCAAATIAIRVVWVLVIRAVAATNRQLVISVLPSFCGTAWTFSRCALFVVPLQASNGDGTREPCQCAC